MKTTYFSASSIQSKINGTIAFLLVNSIYIFIHVSTKCNPFENFCWSTIWIITCFLFTTPIVLHFSYLYFDSTVNLFWESFFLKDKDQSKKHNGLINDNNKSTICVYWPVEQKNCKKLNWDTFMLIFAIKYSQSSLMNTIEQKIGVIDVFIQ